MMIVAYYIQEGDDDNDDEDEEENETWRAHDVTERREEPKIDVHQKLSHGRSMGHFGSTCHAPEVQSYIGHK